MYLARYYVDREKWIPAINRFKTVVEDYETTIFVEEALHRLVELHYKIGLIDESKKIDHQSAIKKFEYLDKTSNKYLLKFKIPAK